MVMERRIYREVPSGRRYGGSDPGCGGAEVSAIGDYVWLDGDKNGIQDEGEEPVAGVKVILQSKTANGQWEFYAETTTDANGKYMFENLKSSPEYDRVYRVVFDFDRSTKVTITNADNANGVHDNAVDSDALGFYIEGLGHITATIKPGYGETDPTWDAGIIKSSGSVGDYVWYDVNQNGIQDETESGVANIPVVLEMNASGNIMDENVECSGQRRPQIRQAITGLTICSLVIIGKVPDPRNICCNACQQGRSG